jgi:hypothetical protein
VRKCCNSISNGSNKLISQRGRETTVSVPRKLPKKKLTGDSSVEGVDEQQPQQQLGQLGPIQLGNKIIEW